ncbi:unnamed protein product [Urochloa humidicola]
MDSTISKGDPGKLQISQRFPIARPDEYGTKGKKIRLLANHFKVSVRSAGVIFYHYEVNLKNEHGKPVAGQGISRKVMDKLLEIYASDLTNVSFAYDGDKSLFTIGALQHVRDVYTVVLEDASSAKVATSRTPGENRSPGGSDMKRMKRPFHVQIFEVELSLKRNVPMDAIARVLRGQESEKHEEAIRVLDIILRQNSAKKGFLLVRQSFFHNSLSNSFDLPGGIKGLQGYHSSFRVTQSGLSLNVDVSTTTIVRPGPVIDFLLSNQDIKDIRRIDWGKAMDVLKNLRIKTTHSNAEFKIFGLSEKSCYEQTFIRKKRNGNGTDTVEVTVYDYFKQHWYIELKDSAHLPCLNVGKLKRPNYLPIEVCNLVSLQRYRNALTVLQRSSLVEKSWKNPSKRKSDLSFALKCSDYNSDDVLKRCGILIAPEFAQVDGRILQAPMLKAGDNQDIIARNGRWNFNNKKLIEPKEVNRRAAVNFSTRWNMEDLVQRLIRCGETKGIKIKPPHTIFEESLQMRGLPGTPKNRVDNMMKQVLQKLPGDPTFLLCVLPLRKNCDIYGPWKRECLVKRGFVTQCLAPEHGRSKLDDQYLTNVLLKINAKLGGLNSQLQIERNHAIPLVSRNSTIIFGMDVSHGPEKSNVPSVAAVVSSRGWPLISRYRASVCTQASRQEIIDSCLFKPEGDADNGLIRELLLDFYSSTNGKKPKQIIIFRDGVSEGEFKDVLNIELDQIIEACKFLDGTWFPKFTVIVAQKNHHTRFFDAKGPRDDNVTNVPAGTVVDTGVCHPRNYDFYMCAHAGMIGTTRPTHYQVLHDEIGFSPDDLQELVHSLSYVYQKSTSAISVVAPVYYAHLAAAQVKQFGFDNDKLPRLHQSVRSSMLFC